MDTDINDSDEDTETQIKDLEQLTAVLEEDEISSSVVSKYSASTLNLPCSSDKIQEYSKIETALALNKLTDDKLICLEKTLLVKLSECRKKLLELQDSDTLSERPTRAQTFRYVSCAKPYFKDKNGFQPPDNLDTTLMIKTGMYNFSNVTQVPGWTVKDKSEFISIIYKLSKDIKKKELKSRISELKRDVKIMDTKKNSEIAALTEEINNKIPKKSLKELALPVEQDYDWDYLANTFNQRHTPQEFSSLWKLFLHPSINKESWSKNEHCKLQKIAQHYNYQNWKQIAEELKTGRTEYQCFVYFRTNMGNTFTSQKWTKEEEEYLKRLIEYYREDDYIPWGRVAASMENRTNIQIYNKYRRLIELRKGRFLPEEDAVILNCVQKYGKNYKLIAPFVGRSETQIKNRYQVLAKTKLSAVWTLAEDKKLVQLMANQDSTTNFASISKYFPGKDRIHIRARYLTLKKWMKRNPNVDIIHAPRRGARRLGHGQAADNLDKAIEKLKDRMQSEVESKKSKRVTRCSSEAEIEESIIAFMVTECINDVEKNLSQISNKFILDNGAVVSTRSLNTTNIIKTLILLRAKLSQEAFQESPYCANFPELIMPEREVCLVKVKSYSKKSILNTIQIKKHVNVWGNVLTGTAEYVMPPNFSTITGCKTLISHVTTKNLIKLDLNPLQKKNVLFKEQICNLMERFYVLFLWPMLMSNEMPRLDHTKKKNLYTRKKCSSNLYKSLLFENNEDVEINDDKMVDES
ncbi:unnamed protein product [Diatraea saccharalis]|uniref:snRNA-activating protein complex subunit 4 n=1 Tax=Diatraea saccharalis TaxID=40085 RepID=A0A9N9WJ42_9NEOP|nr:unnamed protein product [Diatraea saccharalis]